MSRRIKAFVWYWLQVQWRKHTMKIIGAESYYPKSRKAKYPLKAPKELCLIMDYRIWVTVTHKWQKFSHFNHTPWTLAVSSHTLSAQHTAVLTGTHHQQQASKKSPSLRPAPKAGDIQQPVAASRKLAAAEQLSLIPPHLQNPLTLP